MIGRWRLLILAPNISFSVSLLQLDAVVREAFDVAYDNIYAFHAAQKSAETSVENMKVSNIKTARFILMFWNLM